MKIFLSSLPIKSIVYESVYVSVSNALYANIATTLTGLGDSAKSFL